LQDEKAEKDFAFLQNLVREVRTLRSECTIPPEQKLKVLVRASLNESLIEENSLLIKLLAGIGQLELIPMSNPDAAIHGGEKPIGGWERPEGSIGLVGNGFEAFVFIADAVDVKLLKQKFDKELERDRKYTESLKTKLANADFLKNAPPELVVGEKMKLEESLKKTGKLESYVKDMAIP